MTPTELIIAAKASIAADPDFNLNNYCHCVAPHICRAAGDVVVGEYVWSYHGMIPAYRHVLDRAHELLGISRDTLPLRLFNGSGLHDGKDVGVAYRRLDVALDWFVMNHLAPTPPELDLLPELVETATQEQEESNESKVLEYQNI